MGTVVQTFEPLAGYNTGSVIAELYVPSSGPTLTPGWAFTAPGTNLEICFPSQAINYGGGNATIQIDWYCLAATSGTATWNAKVIAVTPGDAESVEASDNATSTTSSATTTNATAGGLNRTTISVSALDSMAAGDKIWIKLQRDTADTSIAQTIYLTEMILSYGDGLAGTPGSGDVVGPASATSGRVAVYNGITGKLLQDGTKLEADLVTGPASVAATSNIAVFNGTTGKVVADGGQTIAQLLASAGDVDGPASAVSGRVASFNGTTGKSIQDAGKLASDLVIGPASATAGRVPTLDATGKILADGGKLLSDLVSGPASATANNFSLLDATGKVLSDAGFGAAGLPARLNPAGANTMFSGTWSANDTPVWNGTIWVPKLKSTVNLTGTFAATAGASVLEDITGLTIALPRAGTYNIEAYGVAVMTGTAGAWWNAFNYTGTVTRINAAGFHVAGGAAGYFVYYAQTANNALFSTTHAGTTANSTHSLMHCGQITVSTTGTLSLRTARAATSLTLTYQAGTRLTVSEV